MTARRSALASPHALPILLLCGLGLGYWSKVLFTGQVLLPGAMLRGFAPFGSAAQAPWNILQWDALGQYYPWRLFAARQIHAGFIPLWNPHQFSGAPFLANGQSAIFYPLNLPFWLLDVATAFGVSALLHTLLACLATYFLAQRWQLSRAAALVAAIAFGFGGYLAAWVMLPTLANTASWLPLLVLCLEYGAQSSAATQRRLIVSALPLALTLCCALLAGHAQIFFYLLVALLLRALCLPSRGRALGVLLIAGGFCVALGALQLLPTLELARLGHRQDGPTPEGWNNIAARALQPGELPSLFIPNWPTLSFSENFGYSGFVTLLLGGIGLTTFIKRKAITSQPSADIADPAMRPVLPYSLIYAAILAVFGLLYATATPLAKLFYFTIPGLSRMGGVGRSLILWSFGLALCAGYGVDRLQQWWKGDLVPTLAVFIVIAELFITGWTLHPLAPRAAIYPNAALTQWLQTHTHDGSRILFLTPRRAWLPTEGFQGSARTHPPGVLPPNGAIVYGLYDVNGYDSLAPRAYRSFVSLAEGEDVSPPLNGNMILLNNPNSPALDALNVRYVVSEDSTVVPALTPVLQTDGCTVYTRQIKETARKNGRDFFPGWRDGQYQPESFRFGSFLSLCTLAGMVLISVVHLLHHRSNNTLNQFIQTEVSHS